MATFVLLSSLGPDGFARLSEEPERILEVNAEIESMGAKVLHQWAVLGQYDFINVLEAPDAETMMRITTALAARGTMKTTTLSAVPVEDYVASVSKA